MLNKFQEILIRKPHIVTQEVSRRTPREKGAEIPVAYPDRSDKRDLMGDQGFRNAGAEEIGDLIVTKFHFNLCQRLVSWRDFDCVME
jgi:hypothetical protein